MKNFTLYVYVLGVFSLFITGCKESQNKEREQQNVVSHDFNQVKVNWIGFWKERVSKKSLIHSVIREFEVEHQDLEVNFMFQEELAETNSKARGIMEDMILSMVKSGKYDWDIVPLTQSSYARIATALDDPEWGKKYLVNFEELDWFYDRHIEKVFKVDQYRDGFGGIFPGPLIEGRNYGLWYNQALARKVGIAVKQFGMTFDDFLGYCKQVNEYNKSAEVKVTFLPNWKINSQVTDMFNQLVLSEIGTIEERPSKQDALAALKKGLVALETLSQYNPVNKDVVVNKNAVYNVAGIVLFAEKPSSWYNQCESVDAQKAQDLVPAEMPVFQGSAPIYPGTYQSVWGVFKNAPHRDEAIELMHYFSTNDVAERWVSTTFNPTGLKVNLKASDFGQNDIEKFNAYIDKKYGENLMTYRLGDILFGDPSIKIEPRAVLEGQMSAEKYYQSILKKL